MHPHHHVEHHFYENELLRDIIIGMSDGLTVPFALAAGLSGAVSSGHIIVIAGLAEIAAGSIAMGLGGFLAAKGDQEHYNMELKREYDEVENLPHKERAEVAEVFQNYGLTDEQIEPILNKFEKNPKAWVDFMMKFELGLEEVDPKRALKSARNIAMSYIVGGLVPLLPYVFIGEIKKALLVSIVSTITALFIFGFIKAKFVGTTPWKSALYTTVVGGLAASAAYTIAKLIS